MGFGFNTPSARPALLAHAQATTAQSGITTIVDISGLLVVFTAPVEPVILELYVSSVTQVTAAGVPLLSITDNANIVYGYTVLDLGAAITSGSLIVRRRLTTLTPGTDYTFKARASTTAGTVRVNSGADAAPTANGPSYLRATREL